VELLKANFGNVFSLDEAAAAYPQMTKPEVLASADLIVHPSGYEGNSMFIAESLASGVPIVAYDVGFLWSARDEDGRVGRVIPRVLRDPGLFLSVVRTTLGGLDLIEMGQRAREIAVERLSIERFRREWRNFGEDIEAK
jgi:glycosyltransferase involved in cell wall biosynthesis